jgi:pimeloyl-ACP methyl ester carboxylesterase
MKLETRARMYFLMQSSLNRGRLCMAGAAAAWGTMSCYPRLAKKLAILNVPHPRVFADGLSTPQQLLKSWYVFAFQLPLISELGFSALNGQLVRYVFTNDPDTPLKAWELDRYVEAATGHGGMTGAINWYRAAGAGLWPANMPSLPPPFVDLIQTVQGVKGKSRLPANAVRSDVIECPVLVLWGERDRYLGRELATPPREAVPKCRLHYLDATHWVHWDQPGQVTDYLLEFLRE